MQVCTFVLLSIVAGTDINANIVYKYRYLDDAIILTALAPGKQKKERCRQVLSTYVTPGRVAWGRDFDFPMLVFFLS